jgi:cytoskeletal protein RodZ
MSFKTEDENKNNQNEDNFGLPDLDYKPLDQLEEKLEETKVEPIEFETGDTVVLHEETASAADEVKYDKHGFIPEPDEPRSKAPIVIGLMITVVILAAGFLVWKYVIDPANKKTQMERLAKIENEKKAKEESARLAKQKEDEEAARLAAEAAAKAAPAEGTIEKLTDRTGKYFVVVASAVDADLLMDHAKKLSAKGVSSKIIPPFGKSKFSRLAIGDHDTFANAQSAADASKADYGDAVWVIKY